ncbi:MAG TPA: hypothetical protein VF590_25675 [Isosphaeraceae bacterium]|jgi:hypothetical protein
MDTSAGSRLGTPLDDLPEDLRARIQSELVPGERLIWAARGLPRTEVEGVPIWGCALVAAGLFALSGASLAAYFGAWGGRLAGLGGWASSGVLAGVLGALATMMAILGWALDRDSRRRSTRSVYALTDRRAISWTPAEFQPQAVAIHSLGRGRVGHIHRVEHPDGSGDVLFGPRPDGAEAVARLGFRAIPEARRVEELARTILIDPDPIPEDA